MNTTTKTITYGVTTIGELEIGDKLPDGEMTQYGRYINLEVSEIITTKSGRYKVKIVHNYQDATGLVKPQSFGWLTNAPCKGNRIINGY